VRLGRSSLGEGTVAGDIVFGQGPVSSGVQSLACDILPASFPGCSEVQSGTQTQFSFSSGVIVVLAVALGITLLYAAVK